MLEGLATWFLNNYLGKYLENLNTDQLSIALLQGEVELENVPLRRDAFRFVDASVTVRCGIVGTIKLKIPVSRLRSEPWSITMKQVYIVVGPQRFEEFDEFQDANLEQEVKLSALDGIESEWRALYDVQRATTYYPSYSSWMAYGTSFIGTIIENLQVHISDVHIRYEDDLTCPARPFAFGFSIESLSAQTCDKNWIPKFVCREQGQVMAFKLVELHNMAAYMDTDAEMIGNLSVSQIREKFSSGDKSKHEYILKPVTATARLERNCLERPLNSRRTPRVNCVIELDQIPLELSDSQYQNIVLGLRSLHQLRKNRKFWKWRPVLKVRGNAKLWWQYAMTCHLESIHESNKNCSWPVVLKKCRENVIYVEAFKKYLDNPVTLDNELKDLKEDVDASRSYEELKILRELAIFRLKRERGLNQAKEEKKTEVVEQHDEQPPQLQSTVEDEAKLEEGETAPEEPPPVTYMQTLQTWFPLWGGWYAQKEDSPSFQSHDLDSSEANLSSLEDEIIGALSDEAHFVPYKDLIFAQLGFSLKSGTLKLFSRGPKNSGREGDKPLFEFEFTGTKVECETRPRTQSFKFSLTLGAVYLRDRITSKSVFPILVSPQNVLGAPLCPRQMSDRGSGLRAGLEGLAKSLQTFLPLTSPPAPTLNDENAENSVFYFLYERRPFSTSKIDHRLHVKSSPLNVVYNPTVVQHVSEFFKIPDELNRATHLTEKIRSAAFSKIEEAKKRTKEELKKNLHSILKGSAADATSHRVVWDVVFDLSAPQILVPEHFIDRQALIMVIDFGRLHFSNKSEKKNEAVDDDEDDDDEFCTPASSPGSCPSPPKMEASSNLIDLDMSLMEKFYDRYNLSLNDMQVIVGRIKDNWRLAHLAGTSNLHVLDKFSITLKCERRIVNSADPALPGIVISGSLPNLSIHVNDDKVSTLRRMSDMLKRDYQTWTTPSPAAPVFALPNDASLGVDPENENDDIFASLDGQKDVDESSKLFFLHFCIADLSCELQSHEKSVAQFQIEGLKASLTRRPFDTSITLSLQSLHLIDTMPVNVANASTSSERRFNDSSPRSPASPDPMFQPLPPSRRSLLEDKSKVLCSLTSMGKSFEAAKVDILTIDHNCPKYEAAAVGDSTHRFVDVNFCRLDILFSLQTWVIIFDFFGIGSGGIPPPTPSIEDAKKFARRRGRSRRRTNLPPPELVHNSTSEAHVSEVFNTEIDIKVRSLCVVLNKPEYEVASASASNFIAKVHLKNGNFSLEGSLGDFNLCDLTPDGQLYRDRFLSRGEHVLKFKFFKFGLPDEKLERPNDASLHLKMSSIIYVHTHRFYTEIVTFFNNFNQLQNVMNRIREAAAGAKVSQGLPRGLRIKLDIEAGSPLLLLPMSSYSSRILLVDLGFLEVCNTFRFPGDEGTISAESLKTASSWELLGSQQRRRSRVRSRSRSSLRSRSSSTIRSPKSRMSMSSASNLRSGAAKGSAAANVTSEDGTEEDDTFGELPSGHKCLLDVLFISLKSMDLRSADRIDNDARLSNADDIAVGNFLVRLQPEQILEEKFELKLQVERNLDRAFCHRVPDLSVNGGLSKIHATVDSEQYEIIRGLLAFNLGENLNDLQTTMVTPSDEFSSATLIDEDNDTVWTANFVDVHLQDVVLDIVPDRAQNQILARVNFIKSRLIIESFSDSSRDVDLVSQEILLKDLRYSNFPMNKRRNVFEKILQPMSKRSENNLLQAEVHFRWTPEINRFTCLLNNMRLIFIFDWWLAVFEFISRMPTNPNPPRLNEIQQWEEVKLEKLNKTFMQEEPLYPTTGIVSRRAVAVESKGPVFELKLNITDSEVVIVADPSQSDSTTVILRSTTVIAYRPDMPDHPFSCNLNNAEVFSCVLGSEEDSALSIIDPVTINLEIRSRNPGTSKGLEDISEEKELWSRTAEIQLQQLNVRLSYYDALMFQAILESFPRQARQALSGKDDDKSCSDTSPANVRNAIKQLTQLGFAKQDCANALKECQGHLEEAAIWLTSNATPVAEFDLLEKEEQDPEKASEEALFLEGSKVSFSTFEFKTSSVSICVIDDCRDADVPMLDFTLNHLHLAHKVAGTGRATAVLSGFYYNRAYSSWEPLMEPWRCTFNWRVVSIGSSGLGRKLSLNVETADIVNFNVTSALLDLYHVVKKNWTEDLSNDGHDAYHSKRRNSSSVILSDESTPPLRRRTLYVPFALKNDTGVALWFSTQTMIAGSQFAPSRLRQKSGVIMPDDLVWRQVGPGEEVSFTFDGRGRGRQSISQEIKINQLVVKLDGWQEMSPVSVDRVGCYFRKALAVSSSSAQASDSPPAVRVVFDVSLEGSARKLITVRSALTVSNKLPLPVKIKLENTALKIGDTKEITILPGETRVPIPLSYVWARIFVRPVSPTSGHQWKFSEKPINWYHIMTKDENSLELHASQHVWNAKEEPHRFCVSVCRHNFPLETSAAQTAEESSAWIQPAHTITFVPPILIVNLLPCCLRVQLKGSECPPENIDPGKEFCLSADISLRLLLSFGLELFSETADLSLPPGISNSESVLKFWDHDNRPLFLNAKVTSHFGGAVKVAIYSQFWIVNKTGLPLLFMQEGSHAEAAGQDVEHEVARMAAPLMFAFNNDDSDGNISNKKMKMRIGTGLHPDGKTEWCHPFQLQPGSQVRRVRVAPKDSRRIDRVYIVGIEVRMGKGRYRNTQIVTLSPRFQLHNLSPYRIQYSQRCFASTFQDPEAEATHLQAYPQSSLAFHWPRLDRDQLLCIRLTDHSCSTQGNGVRRKISGCSDEVTNWSGGFAIEKVDSFHVTVRHLNGQCTFIRVEVSTIGATFCIVLTDAGNFPPPFRIDNFSEVSISYVQSGVNDESLRLTVKPHYSVPYALDEPTLPPVLMCTAPGGSSANYDMNRIGDGARLTYENFIYIVMSATFRDEDQTLYHGSGHGLDQQQLVLDVEGTRVFLAPKEPGKRNQLWRMTSSGMLQHEGSSPPQDLTMSPKAAKPSSRNILVLDIAGPAVQPNSYVPLMLRRPDERRKFTQTWKFTDDGRLVCTHRGLYVQAKDGFLGLVRGDRKSSPRRGQWQLWSDLVLGPPLPVCYQRTADGIPIEQAIGRQRLRPGSGFLSVKVTTDGPTRVLQIFDVKNTNVFAKLEERDWVLINESKRPHLIAAPNRSVSIEDRSTDPSQAAENEFQIVVMAKGGIGLSLVSKNPSEELLYAFMSFVVIDYQSSASHRSLDGSIQNIQVDSQLPDSQSPIILYLSPTSKSDESRHMPAIHFTAHKSVGLNSTTDNAEIFKHLIVKVKNLTLNLEEEMLCKVLKFAGITRSDEELEQIDETAYDAQHALIMSTTTAKRFYFGTLKLELNQVKLSVVKSNKLSPDLQAVKRKLGLSLISFEDANIDLAPFIRVHPFEPIEFLTNAAVKHYQEELQSQAVLILGSTDFLGNPIGFLNDLTEGVSGLVVDGNVSGLIKNVAHGAANSAAKMTGSLSYSISKATVDERYDEKRLMLRRRRGDKSKEYFVAGLKGLGFGMLGGLTSIVSEPYDGFRREGVGGLFTGLGWGLVGTISKPAIGVLDFASGAATAVKESSRSVSRQLPPRLRPARLVIGPGGAMPIYSRKDGVGQELLLMINGRNFSEYFVGHEKLRHGSANLQILISSERLLVFSVHTGSENGPGTGSDREEISIKDVRTQLTVHHSELVCARMVTSRDLMTSLVEENSYSGQDGEKFYVELVLKVLSSTESQKRPQVRCDSEKIARTVVQQINYARGMYEEMTQAVIEDQENEEN